MKDKCNPKKIKSLVTSTKNIASTGKMIKKGK